MGDFITYLEIHLRTEHSLKETFSKTIFQIYWDTKRSFLVDVSVTYQYFSCNPCYLYILVHRIFVPPNRIWRHFRSIFYIPPEHSLKNHLRYFRQDLRHAHVNRIFQMVLNRIYIRWSGRPWKHSTLCKWNQFRKDRKTWMGVFSSW